MNILKIWKSVLIQPTKIFDLETQNANLLEGAKHLAIASVITALVSFLGQTLFGVRATGIPKLLPAGGIPGLLADIVTGPITAIALWLFWSGVCYVFARFLGGKGDFITQSYLISLYSAPMMIIAGFVPLLVRVIPPLGFYGILTKTLSVYSLYLLSLALNTSHKYGILKAVWTWIIAAVLLFIGSILFGLVFIGGAFGNAF